MCLLYQADLLWKGGQTMLQTSEFSVIFLLKGFPLYSARSGFTQKSSTRNINSFSLLLSNYNISASTKPDSLIFKSYINSHHRVLCSRFSMVSLDLGECYIKCVHWRVSNQVISSIYKNWILKVILIISLNPGLINNRGHIFYQSIYSLSPRGRSQPGGVLLFPEWNVILQNRILFSKVLHTLHNSVFLEWSREWGVKVIHDSAAELGPLFSQPAGGLSPYASVKEEIILIFHLLEATWNPSDTIPFVSFQ